MHFKIFCVLLLLKCLRVAARGRIPIAQMFPKTTEIPPTLINTTENIDLPGGFNPLPPPIQPLLYPFATEEPPRKNLTNTTPGWRPIEADQSSARSSSLSSASTESQNDFTSYPSFKETVVYGNWKPERPLQPEVMEEYQNITEKPRSKETPATTQSNVRRRIGGFVGEVERKKYFEDSASTESLELLKSLRRNNNNNNTKKQGRRKIPHSNEKKSYDPILKSRILDAMDVIRVNATDPELLKMAKQINESIEATTRKPFKNKILNQQSTESLEQSNSSNTSGQVSLQVSKEWPTDFATSNENSKAVLDTSSAQENSYHFFGDSSEPPQALAGVNFDEVISPPVSFNITKMGIPYENQNSGEDPSICVPLSVRERSASNDNEIIEVERVYCFPLPSSDAKRFNDHETVTLDKDAQFSVVSYDEISSSGVKNVKSIFWFIGLSFLLV